MADFLASSVGVAFVPVLDDFHKKIKKELNLEATGRDLSDDLMNPLKKESEKAAQKAKDNIDKELGKAGKKTKLSLTKPFSEEGRKAGQKFARSVNKAIKNGIKVVGVAALAGGALFLKDAISEASDLEQSIGALESVFKDNAGTMQKYSEEAAQTMGLSKNEYNELVTILGTQLKAGGFDGSELTSEVQNLTLLGADLSSMFGGTTPEAVNALSAALRGEMEPARRYGITLDQAAIQNKALEMGLISAGEEMDANAKTQATLALITEQTADAQGNFARENDTLAGKTARAKAAFDNMKATVGGALLPALTAVMEVVNTSVIPGFESLAGGVERVVGFVGDNLPVIGVLTGTLAGVATSAYLAGGGLAMMGGAAKAAFLAIKTGIKSIPVIGWIIAAIGLATAALTYFFTKTETGKRLWEKIWPAIKNAAQVVVDWFMNSALPVLQAVWDKIVAGATWLWEKMKLVWQGVKLGFSAFLSWAREEIVPRFMAVWEAISESASNLWDNHLKPAFEKVKNGIMPVIDWVREKLSGLFGGDEAKSGVDKLAANLQLVGNVAKTVFNVLKAVFTGITWVLENILLPVFQVVFAAIGWVVTIAVNVISGVITGLIWLWQNVLAPVAMWLWQNIIVPVFNGIVAAVKIAINVVTAIIQGLVWFWQNVLSPVLNWLWGIFKAVWEGIKIAVAVVVTAITVYINLLKWYFQNVIAPVAMWLWKNVFKPVWEGIKLSIQIMVTWFKDVAWPLLSTVVNWIRTKFEQFKIGLGIIWAYIKNNIINPVVAWFRDTAWPLISLIIDWIKNKFENFKLGLEIIWKYIKNTIINPVITWFRDTAWPAISNVIDKIKNGFQGLKDRMKTIWDNIRDNVVNPVVNWFEDKVVDRIEEVVDKVKTAFSNMKDSVAESWAGLKEKVLSPVKWIVDKVINEGIIATYNKVAGTFNAKEMDPIDTSNWTTSGFARGGYTGPGSKYQPAGVVHADEFVIRKESQNSIKRAAPGYLDRLNKYGASALGMGGYAGGGLVKLGSPFIGYGPRGDGFGARGGKHRGIDYALPHGKSLIATEDGIANRSTNSAAGNKLTLEHGNGLATTYHHLSGYAVGDGEQVRKGQVVGYVGNTGRSTGPHLHLGVKLNGQYVDPTPYLGVGGLAGIGMLNPFDNLFEDLKTKIHGELTKTPFRALLTSYVKKQVDDGRAYVSEKLKWLTDGVEVVKRGAGALAWSPIAGDALRRAGQFSLGNLDSMLRRIAQESGGNPTAINTWDSNAALGTPSKGLMQVIQPTFDTYRDRSLPNDIWHPMSNMMASINYTLARYGSLRAGWDRPGGYADGGIVKPYLHDNGGVLHPGLSFISNQTRRPEAILTDRQWDTAFKAMENQTNGGSINQTFNIRDTDATVGRIANEVNWAMRSSEIRGRI